jgi:hypothetical protein
VVNIRLLAKVNYQLHTARFMYRKGAVETGLVIPVHLSLHECGKGHVELGRWSTCSPVLRRLRQEDQLSPGVWDWFGKQHDPISKTGTCV